MPTPALTLSLCLSLCASLSLADDVYADTRIRWKSQLENQGARKSLLGKGVSSLQSSVKRASMGIFSKVIAP
jgi:hypothetical protein